MADQAVQISTRIRRFRRVERAALPFVPWGLLPLGGLGLLWLACWPAGLWIESAVRDAAEDALAEAGLGWASVEVSGQWVSLGGAPPSPEEGRRAEALALAAVTDTWLGALPPATRVTSRFERPPACAPAPAPAPPAGWSFRLVAGELRLTGQLPDEASRQRVVEAAQALIQPPRLASVRDELAVGSASEIDPAVALRGIETVGRCDSGEAALRDGAFSLRCELGRGVEAEVRERASAPLPDGVAAGELTLLVTEEIASCEEALGTLLEGATIEFETESAEIGESSGPLLDRVAEEARRCPGTLRVEGHTDSQGAAEFNLALSQRRAESVRSALVHRGLGEERLVARGFGDRSPRGDNATPAGRARNRRIEIKVVRSHD